jgi:hypothetical protein
MRLVDKYPEFLMSFFRGRHIVLEWGNKLRNVRTFSCASNEFLALFQWYFSGLLKMFLFRQATNSQLGRYIYIHEVYIGILNFYG